MARRTMITAVLLVGLLSTSCTAEQLDDSTLAEGLAAAVPFTLHGSNIIVELAVDGSDPLTFIFDTGAGGTIISARTADRLGITGDEAVSRQGAAGDAPVVLSEKHTIRIGDLSLPDTTLGITELDHIDRRFGIRIDGAIGWKILSQYALRLNYDSMQIEIYDTRRFDYSLDAPGYDLEVSGTTLFINAAAAFESGAVFSGKVVVDTGSGGSFVFNTPFARENDLLAAAGDSYQREVAAGLSTDRYQIYTTMLTSLSIGQHEFAGVPAGIAFAEAGALAWPGIMGILGNNILMRFNVFIDIQQNRMYLEPNQLYYGAFEVNCSGLELVMDDTFEKVVVNDIYDASPAQESGLQVGDEILQVDGVSASGLELPQIRSLLSQDGKVVEVWVNREGEQISYLLRLRPLIGLRDTNQSPSLPPTQQVEPQTQPTPTPAGTETPTPTPMPQVGPLEFWVRPLDGMSMLAFPGGAFQMGSTAPEIEDAIALCREHYSICNRWYYERESPLHPVSLDSFWLDQTEISNAQYRLCVGAGVCPQPTVCQKGEPTFDDADKADHPVVCVSWDEAQAYCSWVGARLPTEAEWEYAFRGGAGSIYPWGDEFDGSRLNYCDRNCSQPHADQRFDDGYPLTAPVGSYPQGASWSGILDMGGNVSEWVADWLGEYSLEPQTNPAGPGTGSEKMLKGCSWYAHPTYCRGAARPSVDPDTRFDYLGFRCAASDKPQVAGGTPITPDTIDAPLGDPPTIDGIHSPGEWDQAVVESFADGSQLFLLQAGDYLYLGIKVIDPGTVAANVFINRGDEIAILHTSAALGTAVYQQGEGGWQQVRDFVWRCRSTGDSQAAQDERAAFLEDEGWLAANGLMGTPNELEYKILIPEGDFRLAAVYIKSTYPYEKVPWPAHLDDDSVSPTPGELPKSLNFSPEQWVAVQLAR